MSTYQHVQLFDTKSHASDLQTSNFRDSALYKSDNNF